MPDRRPRRTDPGRRDRIVDACLDVVVAHGVAGTSHRRVAEAADVPLGSMTYHFAGMDELLREAFGRFARTVSDEFERRLGAAADADDARAAVVGLVSDVAGTRRDLVLTHELYTLAAREPAFRDLTTAWMARSRRALERHFDPTTARMLDALIEGLAVHRTLDRPEGQGPYDAALLADAVARITRA
ncbi:TetR/AcrR family transcriptional regulator [Isoptericola sp. NPDC057559]|uniref:TetR/AcrR family transcriptional regulator n=1 Tax=Isoptericola sp. NPDC057559 TaxID=3346168 RepID=UPI0036922447